VIWLLLAAGLSLRDVQERARQTDPRVQQAAAQLQNAQAKREEAQLAWFPSIEATGYVAGPTPEHYLKGGQDDPNPADPSHLEHICSFCGQLGVQAHADVQVVLPLWTFGKISAGKGATQHLVGAQEALLARARDQAAYDAARAYWGYQTARNAGDAVQKIRDRLDEAKKTADKLLAEQSDQITKADRLKLDYLAEEIEAQQAAALKNRDLAVTGMRTLLALKPEEPLEVAQEALPEPPPQPASDEVLRRALLQRPEIHAADEGVKARQALVDLESARLWPDIGLVGGARLTETTNASNPQSPFVSNPYHEASAYAALAIHGTFEIPQKLARRRQAEADLAEVLALRRGAEQLVRMEVLQALGDLAEARTKVDRYTKETAIGKQLATQAGVAFDSGLGEARELLEDTLLYARADGARLEALYNVQLAWAALEKASGGSLTEARRTGSAP
jgi:outer membrane protein, multidrug efflux system